MLARLRYCCCSLTFSLSTFAGEARPYACKTLYRLRWPQYLRQSFISVWQAAERRAVRITTRLVSASDRNVTGIHRGAAAGSNTPVYYQAHKAENKFVCAEVVQTRKHEQQMCRNGTNRCIMDLLTNRSGPLWGKCTSLRVALAFCCAPPPTCSFCVPLSRHAGYQSARGATAGFARQRNKVYVLSLGR